MFPKKIHIMQNIIAPLRCQPIQTTCAPIDVREHNCSIDLHGSLSLYQLDLHLPYRSVYVDLNTITAQ